MVGETIANGVASEAVDQTVAEILGKEDLRSGDVVVLEKRWRWGQHLTACRFRTPPSFVGGYGDDLIEHFQEQFGSEREDRCWLDWIGLKVEQWSFGLDGD
ncbi:hypothetical protein F0562_018049 [Nyssa sinensis]|uniref:Uncharacterized protein n=1 Tax=Nyssa sinensis TaxID=561372 RepID=A0A5J4Z8Y5_9ASTE|nr:hypothetical protein F0562_018049 [Nyssa sinensis]